MPSDIFRISLDDSILFMRGTASIAMMEVARAQGSDIALKFDRCGAAGGTEWSPMTICEKSLDAGEQADISLENGDTLRIRLISIRGARVNLQISYPDGYELHGDGIG